MSTTVGCGAPAGVSILSSKFVVKSILMHLTAACGRTALAADQIWIGSVLRSFADSIEMCGGCQGDTDSIGPTAASKLAAPENFRLPTALVTSASGLLRKLTEQPH